MYVRRPPQRVEDYTNANLVLIFVNMLWIFVVIWASVGLWAVVLAGWGLNRLITRLEQRQYARDVARHWTRHGLTSSRENG